MSTRFPKHPQGCCAVWDRTLHASWADAVALDSQSPLFRSIPVSIRPCPYLGVCDHSCGFYVWLWLWLRVFRLVKTNSQPRMHIRSEHKISVHSLTLLSLHQSLLRSARTRTGESYSSFPRLLPPLHPLAVVCIYTARGPEPRRVAVNLIRTLSC